MKLLLATLVLLSALPQQPSVCSVTEPQLPDGLTQKEHSLMSTELNCSGITYQVPRTDYTFDGCKSVKLEIVDGILVPVSDKDCKVGRVADCQRAIKAKRGQYGRMDFMNKLEECENVPLTNTLIDGN